MAAAMAMWPGMKEAMAKWQAEGSKLSGTPILTTMTVEGVQSAEQAAQASKEESPSGGGMSGMLGGLGRRLGKKKTDESADAGAKGRATIMTLNTEVLSVGTTVAPDDIAIPAGFKQKQ
jgi:hypothetical protein